MVFWKNTPETWPGLPMPALPTVTLPGLALIQAISSLRLFAGSVLPADDHQRLGRDQADRLEVLQQIDRQIVHRAAGDIGAPLADLHGVAVRRRARDADHAGGAAGAGRILDDHRLAEMRPHAFGHDARDRVGRSAGGERNQDRDGTRGKGLRVRAADRAARGQRNGDHRLYHLFPPCRCVHSSTSNSPGPRPSATAPCSVTSRRSAGNWCDHARHRLARARRDPLTRVRASALDRDAHLLGRRQRFADPARPVVRRPVDHRGRAEGDRLRHRRRAAGAVARGVARLVRRRASAAC